MNINQRQSEILNYLTNHYNQFFSTNYLANIFKVSNKTIKNDLIPIKNYIQQFQSFEIECLRGKGVQVKVINNSKFINECDEISKLNNIVSKQILYELEIKIMQYLITKNRATKYEIISNFYISESKFYKVCSNILKIIAPFNLKLEYSKANAYRIIGKEKDKRNLIAQYKLYSTNLSIIENLNDFNTVYNFIVDTFIEFKYKTTEIILQNITSHVILMISRIKDGNYLEKIEYREFESEPEFKIAFQICNKFISNYVTENYVKNETYLLTQTILGKVTHTTNRNMQDVINKFMTSSFASIYENFSFNFEPIEDLKHLLSQHLIQLIYRINSGTQINNHNTNEIENLFPPAHDISLYFSILFEEHFKLKILPEELSYLTLYFNFGIQELSLSNSSKRILIITKYRPSELILLKHKIRAWFPNQIIEINIVNPDNVNESFDKYNAIFATELYFAKYENTVTLISVFPTDADYKKVNLAINGYNNLESILDKFNKNCFYYGNVKTKYEIIKNLCDISSNEYQIDSSLLEHLLSREEIGSTYFGNGIAIPHPFLPMSNETFISVGILDTPVKWDEEDHKVNLVLLISIEKNNPKAFQLWHYISNLTKDETLIQELIKQDNYDNFIEILRNKLNFV